MTIWLKSLTFAAALALGGCVGDGLLSADGGASKPPPATPAAAPASPGLAMVADARPGERATIDDPALGGPVRVEVLADYQAASGRRCKRVAIRHAGGGLAASRVACAGASGWYWTPASIT